MPRWPPSVVPSLPPSLRRLLGLFGENNLATLGDVGARRLRRGLSKVGFHSVVATRRGGEGGGKDDVWWEVGDGRTIFKLLLLLFRRVLSVFFVMEDSASVY